MKILIADDTRRILLINNEETSVNTHLLSQILAKNHETSAYWIPEEQFKKIDDKIYHYKADFINKLIYTPIESKEELNFYESLRILVSKKFEIMKKVYYHVNGIRKSLLSYEILQDEVCRIKYEESLQYLRQLNSSSKVAGFDFAFLKDHADIRKLSLNHAAEEILFSYEEYYETLRASENIRLRCLTALENAKTTDEIDTVEKIFLLESEKNLLI